MARFTPNPRLEYPMLISSRGYYPDWVDLFLVHNARQPNMVIPTRLIDGRVIEDGDKLVLTWDGTAMQVTLEKKANG